MNFVHRLENILSTNSNGKIIYCLNVNYFLRKYIIKKFQNKYNTYLVGKSNRYFLRKMTVYQEIYNFLKDDKKTFQYIKKRELSLSRINRPLEKLSAERWRASISIGLISGKNTFIIPWISEQILNTYLQLWMNQLFSECKNKGVTLILFSDKKEFDDITYDYCIDFKN